MHEEPSPRDAAPERYPSGGQSGMRPRISRAWRHRIPPARYYGPFRVLIVCRLNQFRSPLAEHLLRQRVAVSGLDWLVGSAGTHAVPGTPLAPAAQGELETHGVLVDAGWASRRLDEQLIATSDLVLVAEPAQRGAVAQLAPSALTRTFLLGQFARFASALMREQGLSGAELLAQVRTVQGTLQPVDPQRDTVVDPAGQSRRALASCTARIAAIVEQILPTELTSEAGPPAG